MQQKQRQQQQSEQMPGNCQHPPKPGLFVGAIGQVVDIVYDKSVGPNGNKRERLPRYIVVDFPSFKPPANVEVWDKNNPMVSERHTALTLAACC
jgi:hypothetical protein